jgi:hypothetical protein
MSLFIRRTSIAVALAWLAVPSFAAPQANPIHLRHSAPFLGQNLSIQLEGALPLTTVDLLYSPEAGSYVTPFGVLELRRDRIRHLAQGSTDAAGSWSIDLSVPLDTALAEREAHFQALVSDPSAPAGRILSDAIHARLLGPRVYAGYRGNGSPARAGLYVVSAVSDTVVARVDYGMTNASAKSKPVFDADFARGAVMSTQQELLFFDPFFGGVRGRVSFPSACSRTLFTDPARRTVYVLEINGSSPARVHAIDLSSGTETAHLDLPNAVEPLWCLGRLGSEVFIAEYEPSGRTAIRWVDLDPLADLGSAPVGRAGSRYFTDYIDPDYLLLPMVYSAGQVFVSTMTDVPPLGREGDLTRCRVTSSGIATRVMGLGPSRIYRLTAVPAADRLLAGELRTDWGPAGWMCQVPLFTIGLPAFLPSPPTGPELYVHDIEADGTVAWIIAEWEWQHADILYRLDMQTYTWTQTPHFWNFGPSDMEVLRDVWDHEVWVANKGYGPPIDIAPEILVVDELHGTTRHIALDHTAEVLHAVPLP